MNNNEILSCQPTSDSDDEADNDIDDDLTIEDPDIQAALLAALLKRKQSHSRRQAEVMVERTNNNSKKVTQYTLNMINFIPNTILFQLSKLQNKKDLPLTFKYRTVVILAEIRNFYDTDRVSRGNFPDEQSLNEHLTTVSKRFLEVCSTVLVKFGGDLIQFLGTAMIGIFSEAQSEKDMAKRAVACALEIYAECENAFKTLELLEIKGDPTKYQLCIGLSYGDVQVLHVGGILNRVEFFVAGSALVRAFSALKLADGPLQHICVSGEMWPLISDEIEGERTKHLREQVSFLSAQRPKVRLEDPKPEELRFYFINKAKKEILPARDMILQKVRNSEEIISKFQLQLKYYIPGSYRHASQFEDIDKFSGQHQKQTVVAIAIEININEARSKNQSGNKQLLQNFIQVVQAQVYKMEGSFAKVISYESGVIILAIWGMHLLSHTDDCSRAVLAAVNIKKHLTKLQLDMELEEDSFVEPPVHIGIATGDVFQCMVGSVNRREVIGIGETKERALALLQVAYTHYSKIYVDFMTKQIASHTMDFEFIEHVEQVNKVLNLAVFRPRLDFDDEYQSSRNDKNMAKNAASQIRIHANPFFYDQDNSFLKSFQKMQGRATLLHEVFQDIDEYIQDYDQDSCWVLAIKGDIGSGKSLFARKLILELAEQEKTIFRVLNINYPKLKFQFIVSSSNCLKQTLFLGIWRPFLRQLLALYSEELEQTREYIISTQIQHTKAIEDKVHTIEEIFGLQSLAKKQYHKPQHANPLSMARESFDPEYEDILTVFCVEFIQHALEALKDKLCFVVVFDNAEKMNLSSWRLFDLVQANCSYMVLIVVIQKESAYFEAAPENKVSTQGFKIDSQQQDTQQYYIDFIKPKEKQIFSVVEIPPLTTENLLQALVELSPVYERTMNQEIEFLTQALHPKTTNKTYAQVKDATIRLISQYQVYQHFTKVEEEILKTVIAWSNGNAQISFYLVFQAILQGFITVEDNQLISSPKFRSSAALMLPYTIHKQLTVRFEQALKASHKTMPRLSFSQQVQVTELLSSASVVGNVFSQNLLDRAHVVKVERSKQISTAELLQMAEERDLIELIHIDEASQDFFYRFTDSHMRAAIYQLLTFKGFKQEIHQSIIKYHQDKIVLDYTNKYSLDELYSYFQKHIFRLENKSSEDMLSAHSRSLLQIKRLMLAEKRGQERLKFGNIRLTSDNKTELVMAKLTPRSLEFYVELKPGSKKYSRFCTVELKHIRNIEKIQETTDDDEASNLGGIRFRLSVSQWQKAEKVNADLMVRKSDSIILSQLQKTDKREIQKAKLEAESWMTAIEFVTTRKNFESFRNRYGSFRFDYQDTSVEQQPEIKDFTKQNTNLVGRQIKSRFAAQKTQPRENYTESMNQSRVHHSRHNPQTTEQKRIEVHELAKKLQCLYNFGFMQFTAHLGDSRQALSEVKSRLHAPLIENKTRHLLQVSEIELGRSCQDESLQEEDDNPERMQDLMSFEREDGLQQEPLIVGQFDAQPRQAIWQEERQITNLCVTNWEWQEGAKVSAAGGVSSETDQATSSQEFKLRRRDDALGYNKALSPYRPQVDLNTLNNRSIQGLLYEEKSPNKSRKTKAENIQKILENTNTPWFLNYMNYIKNRPLYVKQESPKDFYGGKTQENKPPEQLSPPKEDPRRSSILHIQGGLKQSESLKSIGHSQAMNLSRVDAPQRRLTLKTVAFSKNVKQNKIQTEVRQKPGDNLLAEFADSSEKKSIGRYTAESIASFNDYKTISSSQKRLQSKLVIGCPATLVNQRPQYICDTELSLKKGDVVYLSQAVGEDDPIIKCHTYGTDGKKVELIVGRHEIQLESANSSAEALPDFRRNERIYEGNTVRIKDNKSIDSLLNHQELSISRSSGQDAMPQQIQQENSAGLQLDQNLQKIEQNTIFKKVQERNAARLLREQLKQSQEEQVVLADNYASVNQVPAPGTPETPEKNKTPKITERQRRKQQMLYL